MEPGVKELLPTRLGDGSTHYYAVTDATSATRILTDQYNKRTTIADAKADLAAGKRVIMVFVNAAGDPVHSMRMNTIVTKADGTLDGDRSKGDSKNGWRKLSEGTTATTVWGVYGGPAVPASQRAVTYWFYTLK